MNAQSRANRKQKAMKIEKTERRSSETGHCRTCLATADLEPIFVDRENEQKRSNDLNLVTGLEIKVDDGLSQKICMTCLDIINTALQFRKTSRKAEKTLLAMLSDKPKKKITRQKTKVKTKGLDDDVAVDYGYNEFGDDFQNDDGDEYDEVPVKTEKKVKVKQEAGTTGRKKRMNVPNAMNYKCNTCNKEFRMKATYKAHIRFHTNYCVCEACGKRCRNNNQLQEHKRARHGLSRIHKCMYCDYTSATKEALMIHERRHTGERPYVCDHCGATFHRRSNLVQHIAIHLPEKNFQCTVCNKREKSKKRLNIHIYKVHKEHKYRYLCPRCPKTYKCPDHVRRHLVNHHDIPRSEQGPVQRYVVTNQTNNTEDRSPGGSNDP